MCGRYAITLPDQAMATLFDAVSRANTAPRWNFAPTQSGPVVRVGDNGREIVSMRWGLVPRWSKTGPGGRAIINARAETAPDKPMFRDALRKRRAIAPADGFYEWAGEGRAKTPHYIQRADGEAMAFACLWEVWTDPESAESVLSYATLTTGPAPDIAHVHDRSPVILDPEAWALWLDPDTDPHAIEALLVPPVAGALTLHEVDRAVGSVNNEGAHLIEPVAHSRLL